MAAATTVRDQNKQHNDQEDGGRTNSCCARICGKHQEEQVLHVKLACSKSASTDYDLTGQILWPVSVLLAHYIASHHGQSLVQNRKVLELGAGCGLPGLVTAHFAQRVMLTDGNDTVVELLQRNCSTFLQSRARQEQGERTDALCLGEDKTKHRKHASKTCPIVTVSKFLWGDRTDLRNVLKDMGHVDVILAADVVQWPAVVEPLLHSIKALLWNSTCERPMCILGIVERAQSTTRLFFDLAKEFGFEYRRVDYSEFLQDGILPESCREYGGRKTEIYELVLMDRSTLPVLLEDEHERERDLTVGRNFENTAFLPC